MTWSVDEEMLQRCRDHVECGRIVVFDTETTGLSNADEIVQIAAVEYVNGLQTRTLNLYLVPTCEISSEAEAVHGLSRTFLEANGIPPQDALEQFFAFVGDGALIVGHNVSFDFRMMRNECAKFDCKMNLELFEFCDTMRLSKRLVPGQPSYSLASLIDALRIDGKNTHDALDDTRACGELFMDLVRRIPKSRENTYETI